jgi:cytochrome c oxidase subunit IV
MDQHITPVRTYFFVYLGLQLLLGLTVGAYFLNLGPLSTPVALTIAVAKAALVMLFFMNLRHSSTLVRVFALAGFFWVAILLGLTLTDYLTRILIPSIGR